ncbi:putative metal-binding motif-containing protein [Bizionia arctica]|nr:putative metal-binding motif-containing protein [Bizionia arctica]
MKTIYLTLVCTIGMVGFNSCSSDDDNKNDDDYDVGCTELTWYQDGDQDGFGDPNNSQLSCTQPTGYISDNTDFDDANATAYPGADELCDDGIDNNGNGVVDECGVLSQISGTWTTNFGVSYTITNSTIIETTNNYTYHILVSESNYVICLNDASNPFNADLYSKFVFTNIETNTFNLCQPFYDSESQEFIENATDPTNPDDLDAGCGGFAWSLVTRD